MKPTGDDFRPRRDGLFEHKGTWEEVTVGTVIADAHSRTKRWEIVDQAMGTPVPHGSTLWMLAREVTTGQQYSVRPRGKRLPVTILTSDPADTETPPRTPPSDADAIMLLVEKLGATVLAKRDEETGEIVCPDYVYESHLEGHRPLTRGVTEHMRVAHGMTVEDDLPITEVFTLHDRAHEARNTLTVGGFAHRHVPEDMSTY